MAISFAVTIWLIVLATIYLFSGQMGWFPPQVSEHGGAIDDQFFYTLIVVGVAFTLAQVILGYYVWRYRSSAHKEVTYTHGNTKVEIVATVVTAVVFVTLAIMGQKVWAQLHLQGIPEGAIKVEVTAQQFAWNIRYPGADGQFGRTIPQLINDQLNPVGVDPKDPASEDDIVTLNRMAIPVNRDIQITLRSKDVTHSFFVPALRFKQDTTPGMAISSHFKALKIGEYEIACAELCGIQHYKMRGFLMVMSGEDFAGWLKEQSEY
ncbi:MAG: cytochrome c oxidase subunit II [Acidobacteriia bacterium]|jgi:cytochrome c oxidase subunit 2|nr:cytochrome c oxidase subunit II [Terriglobia bacterium]